MIACVCRIRVSVSHRKLLRHHLKSDSSIACATSCRKLRHRYTEKLIAPSHLAFPDGKVDPSENGLATLCYFGFQILHF